MKKHYVVAFALLGSFSLMASNVNIDPQREDTDLQEEQSRGPQMSEDLNLRKEQTDDIQYREDRGLRQERPRGPQMYEDDNLQQERQLNRF